MLHKELLDLLHKALYSNAILMIILLCLNWMVYLNLCLQLNDVKVKTFKILPWCLLGAGYNIIGSIMMRQVFYVFGALLIINIFLNLLGKFSIVRNLLNSILVLLVFGFGFIMQILLYLNENLKQFFLHTPDGVVLDCMLKLFLPATILVSISLFRFSVTSFKNKISKMDLLSIFYFSIMSCIIYFLLILLSSILAKVNQSTLIIFLTCEFFLVFIAIVLLFIIYSFSKVERRKQIEQEQFKLQLEESDRMIATLFSKQREFRNQLQVLKILSQMGKNEELSKYIDQVAIEITNQNMSKIENPIMSSMLMSELIQAKEKGIEIVTIYNASLKNMPNNPIKLTQAIKLILNMFIEQQLTVKNNTKTISLKIYEDESNYFFEIMNTDNHGVQNVKMGKERAQTSLLGVDELTIVEELIKDLGGNIVVEMMNGYLAEIKFKITKSGAKRTA